MNCNVKICPWCGTRFEPIGKQRYCNSLCTKAAYNYRMNIEKNPNYKYPSTISDADVYDFWEYVTRDLNLSEFLKSNENAVNYTGNKNSNVVFVHTSSSSGKWVVNSKN